MTNAELMALAARLVSTAGPSAPSPCISVCTMNDESGLCDGCFRTIDEIMAWGSLDDRAKRAVWRLVEQRAADAAQTGAAPGRSALESKPGTSTE